MKIFKTIVSFDDEGSLYITDTIAWKGKLWLVPKWLDPLGTEKSKPDRIICMDALPHQKTPPGFQADFVLNNPIPKCVFFGEIPKEKSSEYEVILKPVVCHSEKDTFH